MNKLLCASILLCVLVAPNLGCEASRRGGVVAATDRVGGSPSSGKWTQFGGEGQDFRAESSGLAASWPAEGPGELWSKQLGDGYSGVLVEDGRLYTMYRKGEEEAVIALDAGNGETLWEHLYDASPADGHVDQFGRGPRSTPLIAGDRVYTIGVSAVMHALDKSSGAVVWSHDLWGEGFGGNFLNHGYSSSPIAYKDTIIALVGGEDASIVAFNAADGTVAWKAQSFPNSYCTPRILDVDGEEQLVTFMADAAIGIDPNNGDLKWQYEIGNQWGQNVSQPVMADANHLFLSTIEEGARGLKLTHAGDSTKVEELWSTRKIQFYHVTTVRDGDWVYGTTGTRAPNFMAAINIKSGEIAWRERGFAKANTVYADGRLYILDEDGKLTMATATPESLTVESEAEVLDNVAWTAPTIVGKTMYARDKNRIVALDLG